MLSRFLSKHSNLRLLTLTLIPSQTHKTLSHSPFPNPIFTATFQSSQPFSTSNNNNGEKPTSNFWKISPETDVFGTENDPGTGGIGGGDEFNSAAEIEPWSNVSMDGGGDGSDVFGGIEEKGFGDGGGGAGGGEWATADGYQPWSFGEEEKGEEVFDVRRFGDEGLEEMKGEDVNLEELAKEEEALNSVIKGPNRAFGDLIAASGITDAMLDSLMALKDLDEVEGLPPLSKIEDLRYEKNTRKSTRADIERQKQEEVAKARVRQVDEKGRAYGTGRRKCSVARVWIQPGDGQFVVNDKQFDVYFPILDHRAALLRPFSETKTLGLWDVTCTVKGGGVSGQVGAIQLGVSKALQNWEPGLRPPLREVGFLTRDPRVVERKKPGKAKARKSFQWVKR